MELLLEHLDEVLYEPAGAVLSREAIVVQSCGMSRWISMELAKKFGVWGCHGPESDIGLSVYFPSINGKPRKYSPYRLPAH